MAKLAAFMVITSLSGVGVVCHKKPRDCVGVCLSPVYCHRETVSMLFLGAKKKNVVSLFSTKSIAYAFDFSGVSTHRVGGISVCAPE